MREGGAPKPTKEQKERSAMTTEEWYTWFSGHWNFAGAKQEGHLAMFPEELPHRLIKMFAFRGDTVLDPFMGSGTTSLAAKNLERNSVGYEINPEFIEIARQKLNTRQSDFMGTEYEFLHDTVKGDVAAAIEQLPLSVQRSPQARQKNRPPKTHLWLQD